MYRLPKLISITIVAIILSACGSQVPLAPGPSDIWATFNTSNSLSSNQVHCLSFDSQGNLWAGTEFGVSIWNGTRFEVINKQNGLIYHTVTEINHYSDNAVWFATPIGASHLTNKFSTSNKVWHSYTINEGLVNSNVRTIAVDNNGAVWFGTADGVSRFQSLVWDHFHQGSLNAGLIHDRVNKIVIDNFNNKWFATEFGVCQFSGSNWVWQPIVNQLQAYNFTVFIDSNGWFWFGTLEGALMFNGQSWVNYNQNNSGLLYNEVTAISEDQAGNMWFGSIFGASRFDGSTWTTYTKIDGLAENFVTSIAVDDQDNIWFGTMGGGISKLTKQENQ